MKSLVHEARSSFVPMQRGVMLKDRAKLSYRPPPALGAAPHSRLHWTHTLTSALTKCE